MKEKIEALLKTRNAALQITPFVCLYHQDDNMIHDTLIARIKMPLNEPSMIIFIKSRYYEDILKEIRVQTEELYLKYIRKHFQTTDDIKWEIQEFDK